MVVTKDRCLCGTHVHLGSKIIAWICIVLAALGILTSVLSLLVLSGAKTEISTHHSKNGTSTATSTTKDTGASNISGIFFNAIQLAAAIFLLLGIQKQKPGYYWPYLIITGIQMVIGVLACIVLFIVTILFVIGISASEHFSKDGQFLGVGFGLIFGILDFFLFFWMFIFVYFFFIVVNRSRKVTEEELYDKNSPPPTYYNQSQSQGGYQPQRENPNYNDKV